MLFKIGWIKAFKRRPFFIADQTLYAFVSFLHLREEPKLISFRRPFSIPLLSLSFSDIGASSLKKGIFFCPDPYVKFRIVSADESVVVRHQEQHCRTNVRRNTVDPVWDGEVVILIMHRLCSGNDGLFKCRNSSLQCTRTTKSRSRSRTSLQSQGRPFQGTSDGWGSTSTSCCMRFYQGKI